MKLTFKDLKQQKFEIEADPSDTIAKVKERIAAEKQWEPSTQKLIYSGKILADDKTIADYKVEEKGFIVCMISKPKPAPSAAASSSASTPVKTPSTPAQVPKAPSTPAAPAPAAPGSTTTSAAPPATPSPAGAGSGSNDPGLVMGAQREAVIQNMMEMGFERAHIENCMRAAFYNPDRAVEYLMSGIPENLQQPQLPSASAQPAQPSTSQPAAQPAAAPAAAPAGSSEAAESENINLFEAAAAAAANRSGTGAARPGAAAAAAAGAGAGAGAGAANLEFLRNNAQFQQLRRLVQESPQMLEPILQQVGQGNPQLAQMISQNPDAFLQLLSEDDGEEGLPPGMVQISVSPEEEAAINRLCGLGFQREMVIQAYFACDKNEELTANYLFDNPELGDDLEGQ